MKRNQKIKLIPNFTIIQSIGVKHEVFETGKTSEVVVYQRILTGPEIYTTCKRIYKRVGAGGPLGGECGVLGRETSRHFGRGEGGLLTVKT